MPGQEPGQDRSLFSKDSLFINLCLVLKSSHLNPCCLYLHCSTHCKLKQSLSKILGYLLILCTFYLCWQLIYYFTKRPPEVVRWTCLDFQSNYLNTHCSRNRHKYVYQIYLYFSIYGSIKCVLLSNMTHKYIKSCWFYFIYIFLQCSFQLKY